MFVTLAREGDNYSLSERDAALAECLANCHQHAILNEQVLTMLRAAPPEKSQRDLLCIHCCDDDVT